MRKLLLVPFLICGLSFGQLPAPNSAGVAMGHLHLRVPDIDVHKKLWTEVFGGTPLKLGQFDFVKLPDLLVLIQKGDGRGATDGSVIGHVGLKARDAKAIFGKAKAAGYNAQPPFITAPDGVKIEVVEDATMTAPVANHHIHWYTGSVDETKAWYVKTFGAKPGRRANFEAADLPGVNLTFAKAEAQAAPTKGRALDHIGFEVKNLEEFCRKLEASGVKFDTPYRKIPNLGLAIAFFADPWGTTIELTEGLDKL